MKKAPRWIALFSSFVFLSQAALAEDIKIGIMLPLTGTEMNEAPILKKALDLAIKQVNQAGGIHGKKFVSVIEDTHSTPQSAHEAYGKLIDDHKVAAVITSFKSAQIVSMIPKMLKDGVPTIIGGTSPRLTEEGKWMFRTRPDDRIAAAAMVDYLKTATSFKKIGIIHDVGAFGQGGANLVEKHAKDAGMTIVKRVGIGFGEKNIAPLVKQIKDSGAEVMIVYIANMDESSGVEIEWSKIGKPFMYLGSPSSQTKLALDTAKENAEGIYAIVDFAFGQSPESSKYEAEYRAEYKEDPDSISAYIYDGVKILARAMKEVGEDKNKIREYIMNIKNTPGVMGNYTFAPLGDGLHAVSIVQVTGGKRKLIKVVNVH